MIRKLLPEARQHLCGNFLALDSPKEGKWPSMRCRGFETTFEQVCRLLDSGLEQDDLLDLITNSASN
jgi:hypothetical protein